jgi:RHS repeat-associated protein
MASPHPESVEGELGSGRAGYRWPRGAFLVAAASLVLLYASSAFACVGFIGSMTYGTQNKAAPNVQQCLHEAALNDPVNCATGNLTESQTDLAVGGRMPMEVIRAYNSQLAVAQKSAGAFGYGWTGPYSDHIEFNKEAETATVVQANGATAVFYSKEGKYTTDKWTQAKLVKEGENYIYTEPDQVKMEFNSSGRLSKVIDRHSNAITLSYNGKGQLETATVKGSEFASHKLTFTYNAGGQVESIKDPMGRVAKYSYESGNLVAVYLPGQETARWKFGYDGSHQMTSLTDGRGNTMKTTYDELHRVASQTDPMERKTTWEYKALTEGSETTITEPNKSVTVEKFNRYDEPISVTRASGTALAATTAYTYDEALNLTSVTDPNKHTTYYGYDSHGNRTSEKDPNGNETKWAYNETHDIESITTPKGEITEFGHDEFGDVEWIFREGPGETFQETDFEHNTYGDLTARIDPLGRTTKYEYDTFLLNFGQRKAEIDPEGDKRTWVYNEDEEVTSEVSPRGNEEGAEASKFTTTIERDSQGRPKAITDPLGHTVKYVYDASGNVESLTDANGHTTTYTYNADNERTKVKAPNGNTTETGYDSMGQLLSKTDGNAHTTKYERNALEELTEEVDPLERKTKKTYDAAGNLEKATDAEGRTTTYTYDAANRLTKVSYSEEATPSVSLEYDKDGNVVVMKDGTGTTKKTYDQLDRLTEVENGNKEVVKYKYDLGEELTELTYPNGKSVTRAFDKAGRLEKITDWLKGETKFTYNRDSALKTITFPTTSGNKDEIEYNAVDRQSKTTMLKGAETLASLTYTREKLGQLEVTTQTGLPGAEKTEYGYDENNRLTKGAGSSFEYDAANNPTKVGSATFSYDKASELEKGGGVTYSFNKVGERTKTTPEVGPATTYGYDQAGNLTSVKRPEEGKVAKIEDSYAYDGTGLRTSQTISGTTTHMVWGTAEKLPLLLADGTNSYIYGPEGAPIEQINSKEEPLYLHHDQQGSTRLLTSSVGKVEGSYTYTPYGEVEAHTGASTPMGYGGQYTSNDTGLIYLRARAYDPITAQFISLDPKLFETGTPYTYAGNNPMSAGDPSGLLTEGLCVQGGASIATIDVAVTGCVVGDGHGQTGFTFSVSGSMGVNTVAGAAQIADWMNVPGNIDSLKTKFFGSWWKSTGDMSFSQIREMLHVEGHGSFQWQRTSRDSICDLEGGGHETGFSVSIAHLQLGFSGSADSKTFSLGVTSETAGANVTSEWSHTWVKPINSANNASGQGSQNNY